MKKRERFFLKIYLVNLDESAVSFGFCSHLLKKYDEWSGISFFNTDGKSFSMLFWFRCALFVPGLVILLVKSLKNFKLHVFKLGDSF